MIGNWRQFNSKFNFAFDFSIFECLVGIYLNDRSLYLLSFTSNNRTTPSSSATNLVSFWEESWKLILVYQFTNEWMKTKNLHLYGVHSKPKNYSLPETLKYLLSLRIPVLLQMREFLYILQPDALFAESEKRNWRINKKN